MDDLLKLPLSVRQTWLKVMGAIPHMTPATTPGAAKEFAEGNKITDAERDEFRRYFPDGFFGRIELNPPPQNDQALAQPGRKETL